MVRWLCHDADGGSRAGTRQRQPQQQLGGYEALGPARGPEAGTAGEAAMRADGRAQGRRLQAGGGDRRKHECERVALAPDPDRELLTSRTGAQVAPQGPPEQCRAASACQLGTNLLTIQFACHALVHERGPSLKDERLDLLGLAAQHLGDLYVREVTQLEEHERGALAIWKRRQPRHQLAQFLSLPDDVCEALGRGGEGLDSILVQARALPTGAEHRYAAVAPDRVQPRAQFDLLARRDEIAMGCDESLLRRVLPVLARAEHVTAEGEDVRVVTIVNRLERAPLAGAE
jgi:hypothetical protein